ncbi:hypothetical protein M422DRAFT_273717 [Sphaerobolus stellatus SS14]|uniref:Peptidase C14 caspase domain-containing protein n=1 Tax=Sphaerobolus stellatus (strain SS14) TaxID=990650 RepID=A0A0C9UJC2_SPHS4|nr:hypothetical protein M422DRAFT_273717 [Sphaerobolus stellatus SS14]
MPSLPSTFNRKALCIGIEYRNAKNALPGAHEDCQAVAKVLRDKFGYEVTTLMDDGKGSSPTRDNILCAIRDLVADAQSGDRIFLHYSGHGGQIENTNGTESDGQDEVLIPIDPTITLEQWNSWDPCDDKRVGWRESIIVDDELHKLLKDSIPQGCHFNALFDSCNAGTALDLAYNLRFKEQGVITCACPNCLDLELDREQSLSPTETLTYQWPPADFGKCLTSISPMQITFKDLLTVNERCKDTTVMLTQQPPPERDISLWAACRDGTRAWGTRSGGLFVKTFVKILWTCDVSTITLHRLLCTTDHFLREKAIKPHMNTLVDDPYDQLQYFQYSSFSRPMLDAPIMI